MTENFIREFDSLSDESVMGIYGAAHAKIDAAGHNAQSVPHMAPQLKERYGDAVHSEDLSWLAKDVEPVRTDSIAVNDKEYAASYYGQHDWSWHDGFEHLKFWRLEDAFEDFKDRPKTGGVLPYDNYPMPIKAGQVFVIDCAKKDGSIIRMHYRTDGGQWLGQPVTEQFSVE